MAMFKQVCEHKSGSVLMGNCDSIGSRKVEMNQWGNLVGRSILKHR